MFLLNAKGTGITVKELSLGQYSTCILANEDVGIRCFGRNDYGQLGLGHTGNVGGTACHHN